MAYQSFRGRVAGSSPPRYAASLSQGRHQLSCIALTSPHKGLYIADGDIMKKVFIVILSAALIAGPAQQAMAESVAVLQDSSRQVAIKNEKGILPATSGTFLAYGDHVITGPEGTAVVSFMPGRCVGNHRVPPSTVAILSENTCLEFVTGTKAQAEIIAAGIVLGIGLAGLYIIYRLSQIQPASP
jgi:hypothetical protein